MATLNQDALAGVRVADFAWALAGPVASAALAQFGAEVITFESLKRLGTTRKGIDPVTHKVWPDPDKAPAFNVTNPNKKSIRLDLSHPKAAELARRLVSISDVATEAFSPGVMARLGLDYHRLCQVRPDLIMISFSACGQTGPEANYRGYASLFASLGGLGDMVGYPDGPPTQLRYTVDVIAGYTLAFAIMAALNHRQVTGEGQYIDFSAREALSCLISDSFMDYTMNGMVPSRQGNYDDIMAPHNCYRCQGEDKWISIAVADDQEWQALCQAMGRADLSQDERFADAYSRWQHREELDRLIESWASQRTAYEAMETLQRVGVAAMPAFDAVDLLQDPHLKERNFFQVINHPRVGDYFMLRPPWLLSATPARITRHAPLLGEHNDYVFGDLLGLSSEERAALAEEGVFH